MILLQISLQKSNANYFLQHPLMPQFKFNKKYNKNEKFVESSIYECCTYVSFVIFTFYCKSHTLNFWSEWVWFIRASFNNNNIHSESNIQSDCKRLFIQDVLQGRIRTLRSIMCSCIFSSNSYNKMYTNKRWHTMLTFISNWFNWVYFDGSRTGRLFCSLKHIYKWLLRWKQQGNTFWNSVYATWCSIFDEWSFIRITFKFYWERWLLSIWWSKRICFCSIFYTCTKTIGGWQSRTLNSIWIFIKSKWW